LARGRRVGPHEIRRPVGLPGLVVVGEGLLPPRVIMIAERWDAVCGDLRRFLARTDQVTRARGLTAERYECYFYPHFNLGRIYESRGDLIRAMNCYRRAWSLKRDYAEARQGFLRLQAKLS